MTNRDIYKDRFTRVGAETDEASAIRKCVAATPRRATGKDQVLRNRVDTERSLSSDGTGDHRTARSEADKGKNKDTEPLNK